MEIGSQPVFNFSENLKLHANDRDLDLTKCRLCYLNEGKVELSEKLSQQVVSCLSIEITIDSGDSEIPKSICNSCDQKVIDFLNFKEICSEVNQLIHHILNNKKNAPTIIPKLPTEEEPIKDEIIDNDFFDNAVSYSSDESQLPTSFKCSKCDKTYKGQSQLRRHELTHTQIKCEYEKCGKTFRSNVTLQSHIKTHDINYDSDTQDPKQQKCQECDKVFMRKIELKRHKIESHDLREYLCPTCGKNFNKLSGLKLHEKIHAAVKQYPCPKCDQAFAQPCNLRTHIKLHHEGHRFYCQRCGKAFLTNVAMKRHELIHLGVKHFKCETCAAEFYTRRELIKHQRYHSGVRSYYCTVCYRTYVEKHHLTIHMRSHTGERPYKCDVTGCTKAFMESQKLRRHKINVHRLKL